MILLINEMDSDELCQVLWFFLDFLFLTLKS
jgi:hypothetical protein